MFSAVVGWMCWIYSSYEYEGNRKVTCGMASSQFADSFCFLCWIAAAQIDFFFNVLLFFFLASHFDCQEDKVHIFFYSYKPELPKC